MHGGLTQPFKPNYITNQLLNPLYVVSFKHSQPCKQPGLSIAHLTIYTALFASPQLETSLCHLQADKKKFATEKLGWRAWNETKIQLT